MLNPTYLFQPNTVHVLKYDVLTFLNSRISAGVATPEWLIYFHIREQTGRL
jgi:hypothetical protein